jgi:hypothetical protein
MSVNQTLIVCMNIKYILSFILILGIKPLCGQYDILLLERNSEIKIEKTKLSEIHSFLIQINNRESNWISEIKIPYENGEKVKILEAAIVNSDGTIIRKLKKNEIEIPMVIYPWNLKELTLVNHQT